MDSSENVQADRIRRLAGFDVLYKKQETHHRQHVTNDKGGKVETHDYNKVRVRQK